MLAIRLAAAALLTLVLAAPAQAHTSAPARVTAPAPTGLKAFLRVVSEPAGHSFPRTPAFAWTPVRGASRYEFELAKSPEFSEGSVFYSSATIKTPVVAPPVALPWMTGRPWGVYAHVRAITVSGPTAWSDEYGFNVKAGETPTKETLQYPGMVRWTRVDGATAYDVWFTDIPKSIQTKTNVADEREYYDFHQDPTWTATVHWRVRAVRHLYGAIPNGLPAVSYGPWSQEYTNTNPPVSLMPLMANAAVSDAISTPSDPTAHRLTPGFAFTGTMSAIGAQYELYRPYAFSDEDCVNVVYRGAIVGSPAYAPRSSEFTGLPKNRKDLAKARVSWLIKGGDESGAFMTDASPVMSTELDPGTKLTADPDADPPATTPTLGSPAPPKVSGAPVDLWDSGWPNGRFFWTVVPVQIVVLVDEDRVEYWERELPQDACQRNARVISFGKTSAPTVAAATTPYVSGLSPAGRLIPAAGQKPSFYGYPLVAWEPALGADQYQVQWSPTKYPWSPIDPTTKKLRQKLTFGTATLLPLTPGTWYYRVRGVDFFLPGTGRNMSWSQPVAVSVAKPKFKVLSNR